MKPGGAAFAWVCLAGSLAGCEIASVAVADPEPLVVAEVDLRWDEGLGDARALLHRSLGRRSEAVPTATVRIRDETGREETLVAVGWEHCVARVPDEFEASCYRMPPRGRDMVRPGGRYGVTVEVDGGERLEGETTMPERFEMLQPERRLCAVPPASPVPLVWTRAVGARAYRPEASIAGLGPALRSQGIEVHAEPVVLVGLAVSEADTSIVFPGEFGIFNRLSEDDAELMVALQNGLPPGTRARIAVAATDRNATNWSRGGGFNPSGWMRIPSLFGDGTGVVASTVVRRLEVVVDDDGDLPSCMP